MKNKKWNLRWKITPIDLDKIGAATPSYIVAFFTAIQGTLLALLKSENSNALFEIVASVVAVVVVIGIALAMFWNHEKKNKNVVNKQNYHVMLGVTVLYVISLLITWFSVTNAYVVAGMNFVIVIWIVLAPSLMTEYNYKNFWYFDKYKNKPLEHSCDPNSLALIGHPRNKGVDFFAPVLFYKDKFDEINAFKDYETEFDIDFEEFLSEKNYKRVQGKEIIDKIKNNKVKFDGVLYTTKASIEEPKASIEEPKASIEEPKASIEEPKASIEEPKASTKQPKGSTKRQPIDSILPCGIKKCTLPIPDNTQTKEVEVLWTGLGPLGTFIDEDLQDILREINIVPSELASHLGVDNRILQSHKDLSEQWYLKIINELHYSKNFQSLLSSVEKVAPSIEGIPFDGLAKIQITPEEIQSIRVLAKEASSKKTTNLWFDLGRIMQFNDFKDEAKLYYEAAIHDNPQHMYAYYDLAIVLEELEHANPKPDYSSAIKNFQEAVKNNPRFSDGWFNLGMTYYNKSKVDLQDRSIVEDLKDACKTFERITEIDEKNADAWSWYGYFLENTGDNAGAVDAYKHVVDLRKVSVEDWGYYAKALEKAGDTEKAKKAQNAIQNLQKNNIEDLKEIISHPETATIEDIANKLQVDKDELCTVIISSLGGDTMECEEPAPGDSTQADEEGQKPAGESVANLDENDGRQTNDTTDGEIPHVA